MNDITTTPTADLLAEWGKMKELLASDARQFEKYGAIEKKNSIASELDSRCEDAGISIDDGQPMFTKFDDYEIHEPEKDYCPSLESATVRIAPKELRDLLTWLLMKGGNR